MVVAVLVAGPARADAPADEVAAQVNDVRATAGVGALVRDPALDAAAVAWAQQMAATGAFEHSTNSWRQSYARPGWTVCCGENIAAGYGTSTDVMTAWMDSNGHRANILSTGYSHVGVGHVAVPGTRYTHYWVQVFATYPFDRAAHEAFVAALYRDLLGRTASAAEAAGWVDALGRGMSRHEVATAMTATPEWLTTIINRFYRDTLGREPDARGLAGWVAAARGGMPIPQIASAFYGSQEYRQRFTDDEAWLRSLYRVLLFRDADAAGLAHWAAALDAGVPAATIAHSFYQSVETGQVRVDGLYRSLLGRAAEPAGIAHWTPVVLARGDLALAASLASSEEYFLKAGR